MKTKRGQTALILILLAAAALIFLAITLNWGRVAQDKTLLTVAADQSAALLASDAASLGEIQKQENLGDENKYSALTGTFVSTILTAAAVIVAVVTWGAGSGAMILVNEILNVIAVAAAVTSLTLQLVVIQPGITAMWSKLQQNQPTQQQFYEQGISTALQGTVTDQVNITDYFDSNANGQFGNNAFNSSNDIIGRFVLFYSDRLKMLHQPDIPQVVFFYNQLGEFVNGETCAQNASDNNLYPAIIPLNPACDPAVSGVNCLTTPADPACQKTIPNSFQLNDSCTDSNPNSPSYNPYCDPCCQPASVPDPFYCDPNVTPGCTPNPLHPNPTISLRPSICDQSPSPAQCSTNNPYGALYTLLYDPTYQQNYMNGTSFLEKFGRDQQMGPFSSLTPEPQGNPSNGISFPNGIYPFFWLMKHYSPEVDNINPGSLQTSQYHWCASAVTPAYTPPSGFPDLSQLTLSYTCQGQDCCVGTLANSVVNGVPTLNGNGTIIDMVQSDNASTNPALNQTFGEGGSGTWLEGDNQFCSATPSTAAWPYNGSSTAAPDGVCEWNNTNTLPNPPPPSPLPLPNNSTMDALDDTMHTLSDFVNFSNNAFLNKNVDTLSSTFSSWYSAVAEWIAPACVNPADPTCSDGQDGRLLTAYNNLNNWVGQNGNGVIAKWLNNNYASGSAWCVPSSGTTGSANEDAAINSGGSWGTLPSVIACLNYNAVTPASNYNTCLTALQINQNNHGCSLPLTDTSTNPPMTSCLPSTLGRSLAGAPLHQFAQSTSSSSNANTCPSGGTSGCTNSDNTNTTSDPGVGSTTTDVSTNTCNYNCQTTTCDCTPAPAVTCPTDCTPAPFHPCDCVPAPEVTCPSCTPTTTCSTCTNTTTTNTFNSLSCDPTVPGSYANWVQNSKILASDEAPKFTLRALFLNDVYTRAQAMQTIFTQGNAALQSFFKPCGASDCSDGGPAAQLIYARKQGSPAAALPNSVIYGWQDKPPGCGGQGCAHIVKVTAYSPGRAGNASFVASLLPWIKTHNEFLERSFTLMDRDGSVYVSVKRWDQNHSKALTFPNNHPLWQFMFHNPAENSAAGTGLPSECFNNGIGFGLEPQTAAGLKFANISSQDTQSLGKAFMLNDDGSGKVDTSAVGGTYGACLSTVNQLLASAPESHACARYVASKNASNDTSVDSDRDYSLKFVDCNSIDGGNPPQSSP